MQRTETNSEEQIKIKTICEYLFFDQYQDSRHFQDSSNVFSLYSIMYLFR